MAIHTELENLYYSDKNERLKISKTNGDLKKLKKNAAQKLTLVKKLLPNIDVTEIWNCHYLAYLFQHGETTEDYKKAHKYAKKAVSMGSNVTKWLYAATLDRWLVSQNKLQKFGTQFKKTKGMWKQASVDNSITDAERLKYGVPPLNQALQKFKEKYKES